MPLLPKSEFLRELLRHGEMGRKGEARTSKISDQGCQYRNSILNSLMPAKLVSNFLSIIYYFQERIRIFVIYNQIHYISNVYICDVIVLFQVAHVAVEKVLICPEMWEGEKRRLLRGFPSKLQSAKLQRIFYLFSHRS